jgi:hypothetical protein
MEVPPFRVLRFHDVTRSFQGGGLRVLCSGILVNANGDRLPKRSVLFRAPGKDNDYLVPICDQGAFGVSPKFNVFCAR